MGIVRVASILINGSELASGAKRLAAGLRQRVHYWAITSDPNNPRVLEITHANKR